MCGCSPQSSVQIPGQYQETVHNNSIRGSSPGRARNFSPHHRVQTSSGAHRASYPVGTRDSFLGVKRPGREAGHSHPSSAEVKNAWSYTSTPQYAFTAWCSVIKTAQLHTYTYMCIYIYIKSPVPLLLLPGATNKIFLQHSLECY
jgi:hypothetical protein